MRTIYYINYIIMILNYVTMESRMMFVYVLHIYKNK